MLNLNDIKKLVQLANLLDEKGMVKEADKVDNILKKISSMKFKVHPLEAAVALGELPAHLLESLFQEPKEEEEDKSPDTGVEELLEMLQKESPKQSDV